MDENHEESAAAAAAATGAAEPAAASSAPVGIKCVLVGDSGVGKTASLISYTTNGFPNAYTPTTFDTYSVDVRVDQHWYKVSLCDTPGLDHFEQIRPLAYPDAHVFLLCFAVAQPESLDSLRHKWLPELEEHAPQHAARLLVGLKSDQREDASIMLDLSMRNAAPVDPEEARRACKQLAALEYIECSALTERSLKEVFDTAIWAGTRVQEALVAAAASGGGAGGGKSKKSSAANKKKSSKSSKVSDQSGSRRPMAKRGGGGGGSAGGERQQQKSGGLLQRLFCVGDHAAN